VDQRLEQLKVWLNDSGISYQDIAPASADASFRRYFRITDAENSYIIMDAPPEKEDCKPFIHIATLLFNFGLNVPQILQQDLEQGFLLLTDLGNTVFLSELNNNTVDEMYISAMKPLLLLQKNNNPDLPAYDETLLANELALFPDWYLGKQLNITLSDSQQEVLQQAFAILINNSLVQPQVCVHRDYHSRNLMVNKDDAAAPGVIDFQDAVIGAVTYDLVSLLKDSYINWPRQKIEAWVKYFHVEAESLGIINKVSFAEFLRWFDLMGLQRHLKVAGIFSRLKHRDGKTGYLKDIPRTMDYVFDVLERYPEFKPLQKLLRDIL
jgi:aminoglycoside/choline kinase family phosphotransferase